MTTIYNNTQVSLELTNIYQLLDNHKDAAIVANDPLVNEGLRTLLSDIYTANDSLTGKKRDKINVEALTTSALITLLLTEVRQTNELVGTTTAFQVKAQQKSILAKNEEMMKKLADASDAAKEAEKLSLGLDIFKWLMLALSVILTVISAVATALTFGGATPVLVVSASILALSIAMTVATSVPVDDENHSAMDLASQEMAESIANIAKENLKVEYEERTGRKWDSLSDAEQQAIMEEAEATGAYSSMAILLTLQIIIAAAMVAATFGAGAGSAGSYVVNTASSTASQTAQTAVSTALQSAKQAIQNNLPAIQHMVRNISASTQVVKSVGTIANASLQGTAAYYTYVSGSDEAEANKIKALVKLLSNNNEMLIALIQQLNASTATSWENISEILKKNHGTQRRIAAEAGGAV